MAIGVHGSAVAIGGDFVLGLEGFLLYLCKLCCFLNHVWFLLRALVGAWPFLLSNERVSWAMGFCPSVSMFKGSKHF